MAGRIRVCHELAPKSSEYTFGLVDGTVPLMEVHMEKHYVSNGAWEHSGSALWDRIFCHRIVAWSTLDGSCGRYLLWRGC